MEKSVTQMLYDARLYLALQRIVSDPSIRFGARDLRLKANAKQEIRRLETEIPEFQRLRGVV